MQDSTINRDSTGQVEATEPGAISSKGATAASAPDGEPLRSLHTESFPALLEHLGVSILVTTYQAGKLVMLRADGNVLNTHFRGFNVPMGLAVQGDRLAIGTALELWEYHNAPAVAAKLEPAGKHDACFLPRGSVITGDIQIHEMAWGERQESGARNQESKNPSELTADSCPLTPELWFVNTRFSCLCTSSRDLRYSFVPRWRPPFISATAPEDRCHLNGLAMLDGQPRFVTALGTNDEPGGWRQHKRDGGVLLDVFSGEIITRGLSMPHSPRSYDGRLWVLNSGAGGFGVVDPQTGKYQDVAALPGFTRGLDFCGRYAFIGLSQVRESAVFSGIAIAEPSLAVESRELQMPARELPELMEADIALKWPGQLEHYKKAFDTMKRREMPGYQFFFTGIRIGEDFAIVTNPNELFCEIGLSIKQKSRFKHTMVAEQTNGAHGYVPTAKAFTGGSYETWYGEHSYLTTRAGEIIERESLHILNRLHRPE